MFPAMSPTRVLTPWLDAVAPTAEALAKNAAHFRGTKPTRAVLHGLRYRMMVRIAIKVPFLYQSLPKRSLWALERSEKLIEAGHQLQHHLMSHAGDNSQCW